MDTSKNKRIIIKCKDCNKPFSMTESHFMWFKTKGLETPIRCKECLEKKHQRNLKREELQTV